VPQLTVAILGVPRAFGLDVSVPTDVLGHHPGYRVLLCSENGPNPLSEATTADLVVVPGYDRPDTPPPSPYVELIRDAVAREARLVSICTGTFALAAAGVLDGRNATTHWQHTDELRAQYPRVNVLDDKLFVEHGRILTSAGGGAGIDACLHVIRSDFGAVAAHEAGRWLVAAPVRSGDERQYAGLPASSRADLSAVRAWLLANLGEPITVQQLADRSHLPRRTFIRHFEAETGMPPMRWVARQRLLNAKTLLEASDWPVERIAAASGFGSAANFRAVFRREVGTTPSGYRKAAMAGQSTSTTRVGRSAGLSPR
jgi:transcriptional regulator GlxA family with amidase domain